jgi:cobalt-zinc-cadmium efflux system outer membrane protein
MRSGPGARLIAVAPLLWWAGCASVSPEKGHAEVADVVNKRIGARTRWEKGPPDDAAVADWVRKTALGGLTRASAVEIALVNNPDLGAIYEELGISQADMVQAGLLRNPSLGAEIGFPRSHGALSELRFSLVQDFLDLFVLPLRKEIARDQFEADTLRVAHRALQVAAEAEQAFVAVQASGQLVDLRRTVVQTTEVANELSEKQLAAGNINALERATERTAYEQARLDLAREEVAELEARERLNRLLGLWGEATTWRLADQLPAIPADEPTLAHLESFAIDRRLDVASARTQAALLHKATGLARSTRAIGRLEIGVDFHRDPNGPRVLGPNLVIELPIFDQRQALIARLEAQERQQQRRLAGLAIDARSEVRLADARMRAARQAALHYRDSLLPLRTAILDQSQLQYNGMFIGTYRLLAAKEGEVEARRGYIEAVRDYWSARAELARALGGALPPSAAAPPAAAATPATNTRSKP